VIVCREKPRNKIAIQAFEELYKRHSTKIKVTFQKSILSNEHLDPILCIVDPKTSEIVTQIYNFIDVLAVTNITVEGK